VTATSRTEFGKKRFVLTEQADRMGYRFRSEDGSPLRMSSGELISFGVVRGAVQLPPDGNPVVLNVDHQTTGGYPLLGVVIQADWPLLAQMAPGQVVRFEEISLEAALAARRKAGAELENGRRQLSR
jgi:antagonist of KipI